MNRRALALVSAVVIVIGVGAWWLSAAEVPTLSLPPPPPVVAAPAPVQPVVVPVSAPLAVAPPLPPVLDAGAPVMAEVEIEVLEDGKHLAGTRVELEGPGGSVGRPTDIMGFARFTIEEGAWRVTQPARRNVRFPRVNKATGLDEAARRAMAEERQRATTTPLEVRAPLTRLQIELPRVHRLRGRVIDERKVPVSGADVFCSASELDPQVATAVTGEDGLFMIETDGEQQWIQASVGSMRSVPRWVKGTGPVELVIQPWTRLRVIVSGPGIGPAAVRVRDRGELVAEGSSDDSLWVPVAQVEVLARKGVRGVVFSGRTTVKTTNTRLNLAEVSLQRSPPLRGKLVDASGAAMPGVTVEAHEVDLAEGPARPDGGLPWRVTGEVSTLTNHLGEFSLAPTLTYGSDPVYQVEVTGRWKAPRVVLLRIDDAPVTLELVPAP